MMMMMTTMTIIIIIIIIEKDYAMKIVISNEGDSTVWKHGLVIHTWTRNTESIKFC